MKKLLALLLAAVMVLSLAACSKDEPETTEPSTEASTDPTDSTDVPTDVPTGTLPTEPGEGVLTKVSYTASGDDLLAQSANVVATVGDRELTVGQLQIYYWMNFYDFLNNYSYYLSYFGLDYTVPLDEQACMEMEVGSWQHYFLDSALNSWHNYQALAIKAEQNGTKIDEDLQKELDELKTAMETSATEKEYESVDAMLQAEIGPGVTYQDYYAYLDVYYTGYSYFLEQYDALEITDDMIQEYFTENEAALSESGVTKDSGDLVDARHILIGIEGGTEDEEGNVTYSDEDWEACRVKAQALLDQWKAGEATEDSFAALAVEHSEDTGSSSNGGLYESLNDETNFVEEFKAWYLDESRQVGDTGLVKSTYGYHIMYYSAAEAEWIRTCRNALIDEKVAAFIDEANEAYPLTPIYENIVLGHVDLGA